MKNIIILYSGGMDSTVALYSYATERIEALAGFDPTIYK